MGKGEARRVAAGTTLHEATGRPRWALRTRPPCSLDERSLVSGLQAIAQPLDDPLGYDETSDEEDKSDRNLHRLASEP